jgi:hypothetical protein
LGLGIELPIIRPNLQTAKRILEESLPNQHSQHSRAKPIFVELCSGSANLSLFVKAEGMHVVPIDHARNEHRSKVPNVVIDLSNSRQAQIILDLISSGKVAALSAGIPCGTASRARNIPLPGGEKGPVPLRSAEFPWGLPNLSTANQLRVDKANDIYKNVARIIHAATGRDIFVLIENPQRSFLWDIPYYRDLLHQGFVDVDFQHCRWNSSAMASRAKWTRLRTNCKNLLQCAGVCTQTHVHLPWGRDTGGNFNTKNEAEYSDGMCAALAPVIAKSVEHRLGFPLTREVANPNINDAQAFKKRRAAVGRQPRGKKLPAVISEFSDIKKVAIGSVPAGNSHKILRQIFGEGGGDGTQDGKEEESVVIGMFRDPVAFLEEAKSAEHPSDLQGSVPDLLLHAIAQMLSSPAHVFVKRLISSMRELTKLVEDNKALDCEALSNANPLVARILQGKKLHTTADLIKRYDHPDKKLAQDMGKGFSISGMQPFSEVFAHDVRLPSVSVEALRENSDFNNQAMISRVKSSGDKGTDRDLWDICLSEVESGWLIGPFNTCHDLASAISDKPHLCRRFPLVQGHKLRPIDDLSEPATNASFGTHDRIEFQDVDLICSVVRLLEKILSDGMDTLYLSDGSAISFKVSKEWVTLPQAKQWKGKCFDLSKAYKQLAVSPSEWWASSITTFNPIRNEASHFGQVTLPFGASGAVLAFNRASHFLWSTGVRMMGFIWTSFYDDFPTVAPSIVVQSVKAAIELYFQLLGWKVATDADKTFEFSTSFAALGVVFDVSKLIIKGSTIENKEARISKVVGQFQEVRAAKSLPPVLCDSLRGKVQFMECAIFGHAGRCASPLFNRHNRKSYELTDGDVILIDWLCNWLSTAPPRQISPKGNGPPLLLFTDGACEFAKGERIVTCGALLYDPTDKALLFFGLRVNKSLEDEWAASGRNQLVTEAELLPQLISRRLWGARLRFAKLLSFLDSEPAKFCCVKGFSDTDTCNDIVRAVQLEDLKIVPATWYSRVPSFSNPSDAASRLDFKLMLTLFPKALQVDAEAFQPSTLRNGSWL